MFADIDTPALLLDAGKLERNCRRMRERVRSQGAMLRPHVKTAKSVEVWDGLQFSLSLGRGPGRG